MFLPITVAPTFSSDSSTTPVDALTSPPSRPWGLRQAASSNAHSCSCMPPSPSGSSSLWFGPAMKPSNDIDISNLRLATMPPRRRLENQTARRGRTHRLRYPTGRSRSGSPRRLADGRVQTAAGDPRFSCWRVGLIRTTSQARWQRSRAARSASRRGRAASGRGRGGRRWGRRGGCCARPRRRRAARARRGCATRRRWRTAAGRRSGTAS